MDKIEIDTKAYREIVKKLDLIYRYILKEIEEKKKIPICPTMNGEMMLDNQEVCQMLSVSKRTLQRYRASKELPFYSHDHKTWYLESEILAYLQKNFERNADNSLRRKRAKRKKKFTL